MCIYVHIHMFTYTYIYTYLCMCIYIYTHVCVSLSLYIYIERETYKYIYIYTHTYTHRHVHIRIHVAYDAYMCRCAAWVGHEWHSLWQFMPTRKQVSLVIIAWLACSLPVESKIRISHGRRFPSSSSSYSLPLALFLLLVCFILLPLWSETDKHTAKSRPPWKDDHD